MRLFLLSDVLCVPFSENGDAGEIRSIGSPVPIDSDSLLHESVLKHAVSDKQVSDVNIGYSAL